MWSMEFKVKAIFPSCLQSLPGSQLLTRIVWFNHSVPLIINSTKQNSQEWLMSVYFMVS